ncbi:transmembrane 9 superfamily member 12-like protein, partial [Tanacetum coccineum]
DLTRYEELDKEAQAQINEELSGWKLVVRDVFCEPTNSKLLCVMIEMNYRLEEWQVLLLYFPPLDSCYQLYEVDFGGWDLYRGQLLFFFRRDLVFSHHLTVLTSFFGDSNQFREIFRFHCISYFCHFILSSQSRSSLGVGTWAHGSERLSQ